MASPEASVPPLEGAQVTGPTETLQSSQHDQSQELSSTPIEMHSLPTAGQTQSPGTFSSETAKAETEPSKNANLETTNDTDIKTLSSPAEPSATESQKKPSNPHPLIREHTTPAIGPATDKPTPLTKEATTEGPVLYITLLLASTGARHPFKLDARYLKKRGVEVEDNNPINMSLYKLKELILRDWREEWNAKPSSPESIRLITMGKLLNDKSRLADTGFSNGLTPHIVHMTVKPQDIVDEEEANKATGKDRDGSERTPSCRCIIQ